MFDKSLDMQSLLLCAGALLSLSLVHAYPGGPPATACDSMTPLHGAYRQVVTAPFMIETDVQCFTEGSSVTVTIKRVDEWNDEHTFRGYFVQARDALALEEPWSYGIFTPMAGDEDINARDCFGEMGNAISHSAATDLFERRFTWTAPDNWNRRTIADVVQLVATVVHTQQVFWTFLPSPVLHYREAGCDDFVPLMYEYGFGPESNPEPSAEPESDSMESEERLMPPITAAAGPGAMVTSAGMLLAAALFVQMARM